MAHLKKTVEKRKSQEEEVLFGWYNEEQMASILKWSKILDGPEICNMACHDTAPYDLEPLLSLPTRGTTSKTL